MLDRCVDLLLTVILHILQLFCIWWAKLFLAFPMILELYVRYSQCLKLYGSKLIRF